MDRHLGGRHRAHGFEFSDSGGHGGLDRGNFAQPALLFRLLKAVNEVGMDLLHPRYLSWIDPEQWAPDAGIPLPDTARRLQMLLRFDELEADLLDRRIRAGTEGRVGEIEGIDVTLTFLRAKRDDTQRRLPTRRQPRGRQPSHEPPTSRRSQDGTPKRRS